ncbi:MAG: transglycosylase SLT domain-containing protein, partial [Burkholderiales bacterium]
MRKILLLAALVLQACATQPVPDPAPEPVAVPLPQVTVKKEPAPAVKPPPEVKPKPAAVAEKPAPKPPAEVGDLWQRIRKGFAIADLEGKLVKQKTAQYAASPEYLQRIIGRSKLYLYHIVAEVERRGLPTELALLPMVESAFNPMAYSRAHASGLWQFIPGTG